MLVIPRRGGGDRMTIPVVHGLANLLIMEPQAPVKDPVSEIQLGYPVKHHLNLTSVSHIGI